MKWIKNISYHKKIRSEVPNRMLAKELAESENIEGIKEISEYLFDKNKSIASDCIAVLYEIGYTKPKLISQHLNIFLQLLESKNNRMVWGAMIAIANISKLKAKDIYKNIDLILNTMKKGTVITEVWGIKSLAEICIANKNYKEKLQPVLFDYLEKCRPVDFAARVETILPVIINQEENNQISKIIIKKDKELSEAQKKKLKSVINKYNKNKKNSLPVLFDNKVL
ncbi:MAG: hypothetical protein OEZ13_11300 [Spirochaetia bacterium]|nr:hypothetical protein [Spirochaetia bacterium]